MLFDIVFSGVVLYLGSQLFYAFKDGKNIVVDFGDVSRSCNRGPQFVGTSLCRVKEHKYSLSELQRFRTKTQGKRPWYHFSVSSCPSERHSPRSSTPDVRGTNEDSVSSFSTVSFEQAGHIAYERMKREFPEHYFDSLLDVLPKDRQIGKVVRLFDHYGQIQTVEPVFRIYDFFFHFRDCIMDEGEAIHENDRVIFSLAIRDKRLYAVDVEHIAKRTISSPDFSRLIMRQSEIADIPPLDL